MILSFPDGATIASIHAALVTMGRFRSLEGSRSRIYGIRVVPENKFGLLAESFARNALEGAISGEDLIERYTAFPIYASLLPSESRGLWKAAQLEGKPSVWAHYFPTALHGEVFADAPRLCPACVAADREAFELAYWRVEHQLPSVVLCDVHGGILQDRCSDCGSPFPPGKTGRLPGMACVKCASLESAPMPKVKRSPGAQAHARLIARAAKAVAPELAPEIRIQLMREAFAGKDSETVIRRLYRWWEVASAGALQKMLGRTFSPLGLQKTVATGAGQVPFALLVTLVAFAVVEIGVDRSAQVIAAVRKREADLHHREVAARCSPDLVTALRAQARWLDVPTESIEALLRNEVGLAAMQVGMLNLVSIVDRLPEQHRASIPL